MSVITKDAPPFNPPTSASPRRNDKDPHPVPLLFRIIAVITFAYLLIPAVIVVAAGLNSGTYLTFPPEGISLKWVRGFLTSDTFLPAYLFSLRLAFVTMIISTVLGTMTSIFLTRVAFRGRGVARAFFLAPLLLPGVVIGLALYTYYLNMPWLHLSRTFWGMMLGHVLVTMPFVIGTVSASLYGFDLSLEEAARSLGSGPLRAFFTVTLPNIKSGISAGSLFAFIVSFGQFDLSLMLSTPNHTPLPFAMYNSLRYQFEPTSAAAGTFAILLVVVSMLLTSRMTNFSKFGGMKFS
ncbi:MAG: putative spermidine/putrescine transport system permease protein [Thermomicrobiales bacterium]|jgi:putative spermidine/putrescine transport system permease protein|nr:putative spermidine/putrescine transport system permease protein [Thermomicrobiales bacterium]